MSRLSLATLIGLMSLNCACTGSQQEKAEFELPNGLDVILQPLPTSKTTALVVLYDIGNIHDPRGRSGMAHLAEHLYVTAATRDKPARNVQQYVAHYPDGWNAQTGDRYTVIAAVFKPDRLDAEIKDASQRMTKLLVEQSDLDRELPRIQQELDNMYDRMPLLVVRNQGRQQLQPLPFGGRRGGKIAELSQVGVAETQKWLDDFYKPNRAVLVLAGPFDVDSAKKSIEQAFGSIQRGVEPIPNKSGQKGKGTIELTVPPTRAGSGGRVGFTYAAPRPNDPLYPAFLVHVTRMQMAASKLTKTRQEFPVAFMPLDDPDFCYVALPIADGSMADATRRTIDEFIRQQISLELKDSEINQTKSRFAMFLGTRELPAQALSMNPYGAAFSLGRRHQMKLDAKQLSSGFDNISSDTMKQVAETFFADDNRSTVILRPNR